MDDGRFDTLARRWAAQLPRRHVFRALTAGIAATLLGHHPDVAATPACKTLDRRCWRGRECCTGRCAHGRCRCPQGMTAATGPFGRVCQTNGQSCPAGPRVDLCRTPVVCGTNPSLGGADCFCDRDVAGAAYCAAEAGLACGSCTTNADCPAAFARCAERVAPGCGPCSGGRRACQQECPSPA